MPFEVGPRAVGTYIVPEEIPIAFAQPVSVLVSQNVTKPRSNETTVFNIEKVVLLCLRVPGAVVRLVAEG